MAERAVAGRVDASGPSWLTFTEDSVAVHVPEGSYAARRAEGDAREAARAARELADLLEMPDEKREEPIDVYTVDAVPAMGAGPAAAHAVAHGVPEEYVSADVVVRAVAPELPTEPVAASVARLLVRRWFGEGGAAQELVVEGIEGLVAARAGAGPTLEEARESPAAFVAFLVDGYGAESLRRFLEQSDAARRDDAALAVYQQPLAALEEAWLQGLRPRPSTLGALRQLFGHMLPMLRANWLREVELGAYTLVDVALSVALPIITGRFIGEMQAGEVDALFPFMAILVGMFLVLTPISLRRTYASVWLSQRVVMGLQERMFERLLRLPHSFHGRANVGDLMSRLSTDVQQVRDGMEAVTRDGIYTVLKAVAALVAMYLLSPLLATVALLTVPLFWLGYLVLRRRLELASLRVQTLFGDVGSVTQEALSAHSVIKAFGLENRSLGVFRARLREIFRAVQRLVLLGSAFDASTATAITLGQLAILGVGGYQVSHGDLGLDVLIAFFLLLPALFEPSTALAGVGRTVTEAAGSMNRVIEVLEEPLAVDEAPGAAALPPLSREVALDNVTFGYEPERPVLRGVTLRIPAGSSVALVGPSGCGKSTVVNLLLRFWDPQEGRVLSDGRDIREGTLESLRGQIGLVFQDTFVFDTTLRENIAIGRPGATDAEVAAAAEAAELGTYVAALPEGYDTVLGERGVRMSGGQRQRLAIARALLRDPRLLILDEATSALDPQTEAEISETLRRVSRERTTIAITHRLTSAAEADRIFVLENGELVEEGTHEDLVRAGRLYQRLYEEQTEAAASRVEVEAARLRSVPLFESLSPEQLAELAGLLRAGRYSPGDYVVREGEPGDAFHVVAGGQLEVVVGIDGTERRMNVLNPGDYFGEIALVADVPRVASVRAMAPSEVYTLESRNFIQLLERNTELREAVFAKLEERGQALQALAGEQESGGPA